MRARTWLRDLLGPTLFLDGIQVQPDSAEWNIITGAGVVLGVTHNASTERTDLTFSADYGLGVTITDTSISADKNDYSPTGWSGADFVRLLASAPHNITGLDANVTHLKKLVTNVGSNALTFKHNSVSSSGNNRFDLASGVDYVLNPGACVLVVYDAISLKWRKVG